MFFKNFSTVALSFLIIVSFDGYARHSDRNPSVKNPSKTNSSVLLVSTAAVLSLGVCVITVNGCRKFVRAGFDSVTPFPSEKTRIYRKIKSKVPAPFVNAYGKGSRLKISEFFDTLTNEQLDELLDDYRISARYWTARFAANLTEIQQLRIISSNDSQVIESLSRNYEALRRNSSKRVLKELEKKGFTIPKYDIP